MEIYRELYQISKSLSEFTAKARKLHELMNEPTPVQAGEIVEFDQPEWEKRFDDEFNILYQTYRGTMHHYLPEQIKDFIRQTLAQQHLKDSIEPEEV